MTLLFVNVLFLRKDFHLLYKGHLLRNIALNRGGINLFEFVASFVAYKKQNGSYKCEWSVKIFEDIFQLPEVINLYE